MRNAPTLRASLLIVALGAALAASAQTKYGFRVVDSSIDYAFVSGLNNAGHAAGGGGVGGNPYQAFRETSNGLQLLGTLGGDGSEGHDINDAGQVTGYASLAADSDGNENSHAFLSSAYDGSMTDLGTLGGSDSEGLALNATGQVTGYAYVAGDVVSHAFLYSNGAMKDIDTLRSAYSYGAGINAAGTVVGEYTFDQDNGPGRAFRYTDTTGMVDLGTLGGADADASDVNDLGQIVGGSRDANNVSRAFLYQSGSMTAIPSSSTGLAPQYAASINDAGQIVGSGTIAGRGGLFSHAYLYTATMGTVDLNGLVDLTGSGYESYTLYNATQINDFGQILVDGFDSATFDFRAFVLTPQAAPEPSTWAALGLGALAVLRRRKRA